MIILFLLISFSAIGQPKICLTGTTVKALPEYGEAFENGAKLAAKDITLEKHFYDRTALGALKATQRMIESKCSAIVGFSTGNDLIAVSDLIKKAQIPVISIYGDDSVKVRENPYIATMQAGSEFLLGALSKQVDLSKIKNVLIITARDRVSMMNYRDGYRSLLKNRKIKFDEIEVLEETSDLRSLKTAITSNNYDALVILTRSVLAAKIVDLYKGRPPLVLGTKYFGSSALPAFLNYLQNKKVNAYFARQNCVCDIDPKYQEFIEKYRKAFKKTPWVVSASAYDAVRFLVENLKGATKKERIFKLFAGSYKGISGVKFKEHFKLTPTKAFVIQVDSSGYKQVP